MALKVLAITLLCISVLTIMGCNQSNSGIVDTNYPTIEDSGNLIIINGTAYNKYIVTSVKMKESALGYKVTLNWKENRYPIDTSWDNDLYTFKGSQEQVTEVYNTFIDILSRY